MAALAGGQVNGSNQLVTRDTDGAESLALVFGYDLCAPLTAIPLGELRKASPQWREQRFLRALAMLPFLFLGQIQKWNEQKEELKKLGKRINRPSLFLLIPHTGLWDKPFKDWDEKDKKEKCYSALWDCSASRVVWMPGVVTREEICRKGKTVEEMLREAENEK